MRSDPIFVLVHGWGQSPRSLMRLAEALGGALGGAAIRTVDLGFFGPPALPALPEGRPVVAVAHSLGFPWLLHERPFHWDALVGIAGMTRFLRGEDSPDGIAPRVLQRMRVQLARDPRATLNDFWTRAGAPELGPEPGATPDARRLDEGLGWLAEWDERGALAAHGGPVLALAAADDAIVPAALTRAAFGASAKARLVWSEDGGHALPWTRAAFCAEQIGAFLEGLP